MSFSYVFMIEGSICAYKRQKPYSFVRLLQEKPGSDLLSHSPTGAVPSAQQVLTTLFGMGRGVTPAI